MENLINCIGLKTEFPKSLFRRTYVYADSAEPKSFRILERSGIRSFRLRAVFRHEASEKYCLIGCELNKREEQAFFEALDELDRDLLVMGYRDYEGYCDEVFGEAGEYKLL